MALVTYDPWNVFEQMRRDMDRVLANRNEEGSKVATADWAPAVDIKEDADRFVLMADIPGVDPQAIEVHMENGMLTIKGERKSESKEEQAGYKRVERVYGSFYRRFSLPDTTDADRIEARAANGVLEVTIPKHEKVQPRRISVSGE